MLLFVFSRIFSISHDEQPLLCAHEKKKTTSVIFQSQNKPMESQLREGASPLFTPHEQEATPGHGRPADPAWLGPARRLDLLLSSVASRPSQTRAQNKAHLLCPWQKSDRAAGRPRGWLSVWGLHQAGRAVPDRGSGGNCLTPCAVCRWHRLQFCPSGLRFGTELLGSHHCSGTRSRSLPRPRCARCQPGLGWGLLRPSRSSSVSPARVLHRPFQRTSFGFVEDQLSHLVLVN